MLMHVEIVRKMCTPQYTTLEDAHCCLMTCMFYSYSSNVRSTFEAGKPCLTNKVTIVHAAICTIVRQKEETTCMILRKSLDMGVEAVPAMHRQRCAYTQGAFPCGRLEPRKGMHLSTA